MNKTVNINLGGMFFHIDEDAYQKMTRYFDAIKRSLSNSTGQDEIIKDIEMRIAELISEKHTSEKQVINLKELDEIIAVMGQPEDYRIESDAEANGEPVYFDSGKRSKKLYRDTEKGMLGGVATGLSHYFGIDAVWLKIMFLVFVFLGFGTGIIAYLILWIVTPAAQTTSEKLEMTGEPVTISNIERKVREEYENVSERFKNVGYDKMGNQVRTGAGRLAGNVGEAFLTIFKIFAKVLGAIIVVFSAVSLGGMIIALFTLGSTSLVEVPWQNQIDSLNYTDYPLWTIGLLFFFAIGIPLFCLFLLGLKILVNNLKSIGNIAKYTMLAVWIISVILLITLGIKQATETAFDGKVVTKETLAVAAGDTLSVKFRYNDYYAKDINHRHDFMFTQDENNRELIYSNDVHLHVLEADGTQGYIQIEKVAEGKSLIEAKKRAEHITYGYKIEGNQLIFDNYLLAAVADKYRNQQVDVYLYLPEGVYFKPDSSIQDYDHSDDGYFNLHWSGDYLYKVESSEIKCLNCPPEELESDDIEIEIGDDMPAPPSPPAMGDSITSSKIKINEDGVTITNEKKSTETRKVKGLKINEDGVIIKTE